MDDIIKNLYIIFITFIYIIQYKNSLINMEITIHQIKKKGILFYFDNNILYALSQGNGQNKLDTLNGIYLTSLFKI